MQDPGRQIHYWNTKGTAKPFAHPVNLDRLKALASPDAQILDYGCGYGRALGLLREAGYSNLLGCDPAPNMIAAARERYPSLSFHVIPEPPHVDLPGNSIDAVLLFAVLTAVPGDAAQQAIVAEIERVLRPGGLLYISDMFLQTDARNVERYVRDEKKYGVYGVFDLCEGATVRHHERQWVEQLTAGFDEVALDEIQVLTMNGHPATAFQWFGRRVMTPLGANKEAH